MKLSVVIPVYNEKETIAEIIDQVRNVDLDKEIILVDDFSTDGTREILSGIREADTKVLYHDRNRGKGAALRTGFAKVTGDIVIIQDADLEYSPSEYGKLIRPIVEGKADVVYGSRFLTSDYHRIMFFWHTVGNRFLTLLANMLNNTNLTDLETCYKVFVADCLRSIPLESNRFGIEPEVAAKAARNKLRIYEVPVNYNGRTYEDGKKISWRDGLAALWFIVKYRFSSNYADAGKVALDALEQAPRFNRWMYTTIRDHLGNRIAELGSGRGNLSKLLKEGANVLVTDNRDEYLKELRRRWGCSE